MFEKILVALDGSPLSERIVPTLEPLLVRANVELELVFVVPGGRAGDAHLAGLDYVKRMEEKFGREDVHTGAHMLTGDDPAHEIVSFAAKEGVSLICLGTHGRAGLERVVLGSVAERVIRTAERPVLLVNPNVPSAPLQFKRVVVPLDGSLRAEEALPVAAALERHFGARLVLLHVEELGVLEPNVAVAAEHRRTALTFERARRLLDGEGCRDASIETVTRVGRPAERTLEAIRELMPDVVLMTTHGRTGLERAAFGSVTEAVVRRSLCPVLVVRSFSNETHPAHTVSHALER